MDEDFQPKQASDFTVEEKVKLFDRILASAQSAYDDILNGDQNDDTAHYIYEEVVELLGKGVWQVLNSRVR